MSLLSTLPGSFMSSPAAIAAAPVAETEEVAPDPLVDADSPITAQQIELVQSTWGHVAPIADQAATLFYGKLFELDPEKAAVRPNRPAGSEAQAHANYRRCGQKPPSP